MNVYVARQPIFNQRKQLVAYELLFRDGTANYVPDLDGDTMTSTVMSNTFFDIGMDTLLGGKRAFINFTQNLLIQKLPLLMPRETTVVEILEDVDPQPELIEACREMGRKGYTIALDDFVYTPELKPLVELAKIIKFDLRISSIKEIQGYINALPPDCQPILLAEKVETHEEFAACLDIGCTLFQGYFFCKPEIVEGRSLPKSSLNLMRIMAAINAEDFDFDHLEELIAPDVTIAYKLMRYINSAFFTRANRITSVQQALVYLGQKEIRRFISMIVMTNLAKGKPSELVRAACIRAKFCELLAGIAPGRMDGRELFTLGMFSLIDAIVDQPMATVMNTLALAGTIKEALVNRRGQLIIYLQLVESYEKGRWKAVGQIARGLKLPEAELPDIYLQACQWGNSITQEQ